METLRVLVVDDEPGMLTGVSRSLANFKFRLPDVNGDIGFTVETAATGEQAIERLAADPPDILLLDHKLPGLSGLEVLERLVTPERGMLTVMITAYASLEAAVTAIKRGAYDFLAKPFTPDELRNTVRKAAGSLILARQARQLAREKRQLRFQFISVVAHELKAPLGAIEGYLHILKDHSAGDDPAAYQHMIERSLIRSQHMRKLILDLLDLTRIESGQRRRDLVDCDLREAAQAAIETALPEAQPRGLVVELHAPPALRLTADRSELEIIMNNLVSNAVKYNRDGGRVDVTLEDAPDQVTIRVVDTGIGLTEEECGRLFGDFVRIKNDKTRNILGSGLGLAIVKKLAQLYGGDATVASQPDVGSTFTVTLSRTPPPAEPAVPEAPGHDA